MKAYRKQSIAIGILFLLVMAAYMSGSGLVDSFYANSDYANLLRLGVFLEFINSAAVVGIAALLFPILNKQSYWASFAYAASRIIESVLLLIGSACVLLPISNTAFMSMRNILYHLAMASLGAGSIIFCWLLFTKHLIPRVLSLLGIIGYAALFISGWLGLFNQTNLSMLFYIPGGLFELAFPVWLFVKGFSENKLTTNHTNEHEPLV